jgi:hypothetical protein
MSFVWRIVSFAGWAGTDTAHSMVIHAIAAKPRGERRCPDIGASTSGETEGRIPDAPQYTEKTAENLARPVMGTLDFAFEDCYYFLTNTQKRISP